jgi:hypothetical protein
MEVAHIACLQASAVGGSRHAACALGAVACGAGLRFTTRRGGAGDGAKRIMAICKRLTRHEWLLRRYFLTVAFGGILSDLASKTVENSFLRHFLPERLRQVLRGLPSHYG